MISSSDRRVLDDLDPDSTQTARDRHTFHNRPEGDPFTPPSNRQPVTTTQSIYGQTSIRLANPRPARLAFQLEAQFGQPTFLSHVIFHHQDSGIRVESGPVSPATPSLGSTSAWQTFQEIATTQWQKN